MGGRASLIEPSQRPGGEHLSLRRVREGPETRGMPGVRHLGSGRLQASLPWHWGRRRRMGRGGEATFQLRLSCCRPAFVPLHSSAHVVLHVRGMLPVQDNATASSLRPSDSRHQSRRSSLKVVNQIICPSPCLILSARLFTGFPTARCWLVPSIGPLHLLFSALCLFLDEALILSQFKNHLSILR